MFEMNNITTPILFLSCSKSKTPGHCLNFISVTFSNISFHFPSKSDVSRNGAFLCPSENSSFDLTNEGEEEEKCVGVFSKPPFIYFQKPLRFWHER